MKATASTVLAIILASILAGCGITAPNNSAGFAEVDSLDWREVDGTMTLSLGPSALWLIASLIDDDPQTRALLQGLEGIRVKTYTIEEDAALPVAADLNAMSKELRQQAWEPVLLVQEEGETTHMLMKIDGEEITGITVLTSDGHEVVFVNIMGTLQPEQFVTAMAALEVDSPAVTVAAVNR